MICGLSEAVLTVVWPIHISHMLYFGPQIHFRLSWFLALCSNSLGCIPGHYITPTHTPLSVRL
jgi:hypothetical protein